MAKMMVTHHPQDGHSSPTDSRTVTHHLHDGQPDLEFDSSTSKFGHSWIKNVHQDSVNGAVDTHSRIASVSLQSDMNFTESFFDGLQQTKNPITDVR